MKSIRKLNYRGDTIVEVMIAAALVMATLGVGYALARQGLRQTTDDTLRNQAISYGQSQIEFIKNAIANNGPTNTLLDSYKGLNNGFCILNTGAAQDSANDPNKLCSQYTGASTPASSPISITNTCDNPCTTFSILVQWTPIAVTRDVASKQQLTLFYKTP